MFHALCTGFVLVGYYWLNIAALVLGEYWVSTGCSVGGCEGVSGLGCASLVGLLAQSARTGPSEYWVSTGFVLG